MGATCLGRRQTVRIINRRQRKYEISYGKDVMNGVPGVDKAAQRSTTVIITSDAVLLSGHIDIVS